MAGKKPLLYSSRLYVFSTLAGAAASCVLLLITALVMYIPALPAEAAGIMSGIALGGGCAVSGFVAGNVRKHSGLLTGLKCGIILLVLCAAASVIGGNADGSGIASKCVTAVITGCFGGVTGVNFNS